MAGIADFLMGALEGIKPFIGMIIKSSQDIQKQDSKLIDQASKLQGKDNEAFVENVQKQLKDSKGDLLWRSGTAKGADASKLRSNIKDILENAKTDDLAFDELMEQQNNIKPSRTNSLERQRNTMSAQNGTLESDLGVFRSTQTGRRVYWRDKIDETIDTGLLNKNTDIFRDWYSTNVKSKGFESIEKFLVAEDAKYGNQKKHIFCLLYTSPSPRD